jgi:FkbM family methyltransferase
MSATGLRDWLISRYLRGPEHPGKLRLVRSFAGRVIPERGVRAKVAPELKLYLHPRDWIEYLLLRGTAYEPLTLAFLAANLVAGDAAILAGVNFGLHVARAARAVGPTGVVVGVEPQPAALLRAKMNLELNGLAAGVRLVQAALGRREELVPMPWSNPANAGAASLLDSGAGFWVPMLRLDSLTALLGGRRRRLLLLDVQGYELEALAGCDLENGPELLVVELDPEFLRRSGVAAGDIAERLLAARYALYDLHGSPATELLDLPERNLVAVRPGATVRWSRP